MKTFSKKYQLWIKADGDQYGLTEFDTLEECISAEKHSDWYITKKVSLSIKDAEEAKPLIIPVAPRVTADIRTDEDQQAEELAAKYAGGPIGTIT